MQSTPSPGEKSLLTQRKSSNQAFHDSKSSDSQNMGQFIARNRAASGLSADHTLNTKNKSGSSASYEQLSRQNASFDGFADKVRKYQGQASSTNNTNNQDLSGEEKSASHDDDESKDQNRNAFYLRASNRRSLSYNKNIRNPSWRDANFDSSD